MRMTLVSLAIVTASVAGWTGTAAAHQGHTSCRDFGHHNAAEAQAHTLAPELHEFGPGVIDDVVAVVHTGGTIDLGGGPIDVDPLCATP